MEDDNSLNTTINESTLMLPIGAVAFAPFLLLELTAAVVSNSILLALVILACAKKLNNNINIYLFSFAIGGLIGAFNIFCLLALVVARRWIFGLVMCSINWYGNFVYNTFFLGIYLVISRDKLKGVKDPFHGRPTNKRAYVTSVLIWIASLSIALASLIWAISDWIQTQNVFVERGNFICFGLSSQRVNERIRFILLSLYVIGFWIISSMIITFTFSNFVRILLELRALKKLRLRFAKESRTRKVVRIDRRDKPLFVTGEERTAKSLTLVYFIQFSCVFVGYGMTYIQIIRNFILPTENSDGPDFQIYFVVLLIVQFFPCINPIFLILSNKRLRIHVKGLFKCTLNPEMEASPSHNQMNGPKKAASVLFALKTSNKITPITED